MQNKGQAAPSAPPSHGQRSSRQAEAEAMHFTDERFLWPSDTTIPRNPHRHEFPLRFPLSRPGGQRRPQVYPVRFAALAAVVMTYLLLRCARHVGNINMHKGSLRSLAAAGEEGENPHAPCALAGHNEPAGVAVGAENPEQEQVLIRVNRYTRDLIQLMHESRRALLLIHPSLSVKGFTILVRFCVVELAALCSLLQQRERQPVVQAVGYIKWEIAYFGPLFWAHRVPRTALRQINCMNAFLRELPRMDFAGSSMSPVARLSKLTQLLTLQEVALRQVQEGVRLLGLCFKGHAQSPEDEAVKEELTALYHTANARRNYVLSDRVLGNWLLHKHVKATHFGLASPKIIQGIVASPPKPYEEAFMELLNTPLGLRQQEGGQHTSVPANADTNAQELRGPLLTQVRAGQAETISSPSKESSSAEASGESREPFGDGASAGQTSERLDASATSALSDRLRLAGGVGAATAAGGGVARWSSAPSTFVSKSLPSTVSSVPASPPMLGIDRGSEASSSPKASAPLGTPLPLSSAQVSRTSTPSEQSVTWDSAKVSARLKASDAQISVGRFRPSQSPPPQLFGHLETLGTPLTSVSEVLVAESEPQWVVEPVVGSASWQTPRMPLSGDLQVWKGGPSQAQRELESEDELSHGDQAEQGRCGMLAPRSPSSQHKSSGETRAVSSQVQPSAHRHASGQSLSAAHGVSSRWRFNKPASMPAAVQRSSVGPGAPAHPIAAVTRRPLSGIHSGVILQRKSGLEESQPPFKGVAVGEPAVGADKPEAEPAAGVTAALFYPAFGDPSKGLLSLLAPRGETGKK
ncbi:uncharacterized protein EMH_0011920 [Eimeria mitis]|uniref:Uncharacterized protein n=1 Tax=Eimeria mitis TaxID=44415 RepID=U6JV44_9EIME|nr:uncharacterized protein EMH_0011920 [Eimeria mitis]CDJ27922.1 hypothetical protein EMH_0011920 [Eimeria mitis]